MKLWDWCTHEYVEIYELDENEKLYKRICYLEDTALARDIAMRWVQDHNKLVRTIKLLGE